MAKDLLTVLSEAAIAKKCREDLLPIDLLVDIARTGKEYREAFESFGLGTTEAITETRLALWKALDTWDEANGA
jgi:hypothetical protein